MKSMKDFINVIVPAALIMLAASCTQEINTESIPANVRRYSLTFEQPTRTELSGTGSKRQVSWADGDIIKYYTESGQSAAATADVRLSDGNAFVEIPRGRTDEFINAVYGASQLKSVSSSETVMYVNSPIKDSQSYTSFTQAHLCAAFSNDLENPFLRFQNVSSVLTFTSVAKAHRFVLYGNNKEVITGGFNGALKITYAGGIMSAHPSSNGGTSVSVQTNGIEGDFYVSILPVVFSSGITVECYDAGDELIAVKKTPNVVKAATDTGYGRILALGSAQDWIPEDIPLAVDLGLSVKWARYNLGATEPEQYGDYYAWGETAPKDEYKWTNYAYEQGSGKNGPFSKYVLDSEYGVVDHKSILDLSDDAAFVNWGDDWRMPTEEEVKELMNNCKWSWTSRNGVCGYRVNSKVNSNSIFLPANGMNNGTSVSDAGTVGNYWSSSLSTDQSYYSISPYFSSTYIKSGNCYKYFGLGIRPVKGTVVPVKSIEIPASLEMLKGNTTSLAVTILPENATYKSVIWSSSNEAVAIVDTEGKVKALAEGSATITVYSADGLKSSACEVTVLTPMVDGHEYVDLGLSVKWATCNVGAGAPEEYGDYFAWGETEPKENYEWTTYKYCQWSEYEGSIVYQSYNTRYSNNWKNTLLPEDDAALVNWGYNWRMPTKSEVEELGKNCNFTWTSNYNGTGVAGVILTSKKAGYTDRSIFLPNAGCKSATHNSSEGSEAHYWTSSLFGEFYRYDDAYSFDQYFRITPREHFVGLPVRAVTE